jgi:hypothetical protein
VVNASLGQSRNSDVIVIELAQCWADYEQNKTGLWIIGTTSVPLGELSGSTETKVGVVPLSEVLELGPGSFAYNPVLLEDTADASVCPHTVVVQSKSGAISYSPIETIINNP